VSPHCAPVGTVFEVPIGDGFLVYGQVTHFHPDFGNVVAIFRSSRTSRPEDIAAVIGEVQFITFFVVRAAAKKKMLTILGVLPVPKELQAFPAFKVPVRDFKRGEIDHWLIWDGTTSSPVAAFSDSVKNLPTRTNPSFPLLQTWIRERRTNAQIL